MITRKHDHRNELYLTAIGIIPAAAGRPAAGKKYRHIRNQSAKLYRFELFLRRQFPAITHVNYYGRRSKCFCFQHVFEDRGRFVTRDTWRDPPKVKSVSIPIAAAAARRSPVEYAQIEIPDPLQCMDLPDLLKYFDQYVPW